MSRDARPEILLGWFTILGALTGIAAYRSLVFYKRAKGWPSTRGLILESKMVPGVRGSERLYITYEYFLPEAHTGSRISPAWHLFTTGSRQKACLARFPKGAEVDVYYDPADPKTSCLNPKETSGIKGLFALSCMLFLPGIGYYLMQYLLE